MPDVTVRVTQKGSSSAEDRFIDLFCEAYGPEKGQYAYLQYPTVDIYGRHRSIDFAFCLADEGKVAIEIDGNTWHEPGKISTSKYHDDLLKQNSMVHEGWRVFRWTSAQLEAAPDRVRDELITYLGSAPHFSYFEDGLPAQQGSLLSLMEHQTEALQNLQALREEGKSIALLFHATGTGKTVTAASDARVFGKRTLFLVHRHELLDQAVKTFRQVWPEVSVGSYEGGLKEKDAFVVCATVQTVARHLEDFAPDDFGYLVLDECHHGAAATWRTVLSYFRPAFTLGLTATPERTDGQDLLEIFQNIAHRLDLKTAVELDTLVPVRCIRIRTNIDMRDVRMNGFKYNTQDLESVIRVPSRNQLIVDVWCEYVRNKPTVVFCASVRHAEEIAGLFQAAGVQARCVSGSLKSAERRQVLEDYEAGRLPVLCACDLLNEGWDAPCTQVLFMARPTLSRTLYTQQLGRGMRKAPGKDFLMVFDFVDNANLFNIPYSLHRLLGISEYIAGGLVLGKKGQTAFDREIFRKGERPEVLVDYPVHMTGYETVDLFSWQEQAKDMISQVAFTQMVSVQSETIERYIREGRIQADLEVPAGDHRFFRFFRKDTVLRCAKAFGWTVITQENQKEIFMDMVSTMTMSYSYKPVFLLAFLDNMDEKGACVLADIVRDFTAFYENRVKRGLRAEKKNCLFTRDGYTPKDVEHLILSMPFRRFEDMHVMHHARQLGILQIYQSLFRQLTREDTDRIREDCHAALNRYFGDEQ